MLEPNTLAAFNPPVDSRPEDGLDRDTLGAFNPPAQSSVSSEPVMSAPPDSTPEQEQQAEAHQDFILGLDEAVEEGNAEAYVLEFFGVTSLDEIFVNSYADPCEVSYDPPWDRENFPSACFKEGENAQSIMALCPPPCAVPRTFVSDEEIDAYTSELNITSSRDEDADLEDLVACAWALLVDNKTVIDWIVCTLSADPRAADCLINNLEQQDIRINFKDRDNPPNIASVSFDIHIEFNWPDLFPISFSQINIFVNHTFAINSLGAFRNGGDDRKCACIAMASVLLHELSHVCWRDVGDALFPYRTCPFASQLEASFIWAMTRSFPEVLDSLCCSPYDYGDDRGEYLWWQTLPVSQPTSDCFSD